MPISEIRGRVTPRSTSSFPDFNGPQPAQHVRAQSLCDFSLSRPIGRLADPSLVACDDAAISERNLARLPHLTE